MGLARLADCVKRHRTDGNHQSTIDHLQRAGWGVCSTSSVGDDFPDLVVARERFTALVELKAGRCKAERRLTSGQAWFHAYWPGIVIKADSPEDALHQLEQLKNERSA